MNLQELQREFVGLFGDPAYGAVAAPGRVNLIGEHTDYNDGFVLPIAIQRRTVALWAPRDDGQVSVASLQQPDKAATVDLGRSIAPGGAWATWANYPVGVAAKLLDHGCSLVGCNVLFASDVPIGSGLSSSASLEVAAGLALLAAADEQVEPYTLAKLCQAAEHDFANTPCGIMDQAIAVLARCDHALMLDCRDGEYRQIPFKAPQAVLLVCDTQVHHELSDGGYAARRRQCHAAAEKLALAALRDASAEQIAQAARDGLLDETQTMRARHVVSEIERTSQAVDALRGGDLDTFGELMVASHVSLRDDYQVSCDELDAIVDAAIGQEGVYGARMTGGGFGGCAIVLARAERAEAVREAILGDFRGRFEHDCMIFATQPAAGAGAVPLGSA